MNLVPATVADYRRIAEARLPRFLFDYADGGAYDEYTLRRNVDDFQPIGIRQQVMRDVSNIALGTQLAGEAAAMPMALAPIGMGGMFARRAEVQAKRAADAAGLPFTLSTMSICSMEEVAAVSDRPFWFQLYMLRDRAIVAEMLERAWALGVRTLVFTVDLAVAGERYRDVRNGIAGGTSAWGKLRAGALSYAARPRWVMDVGIKGKPHQFGNISAYVPSATNPTEYRGWIISQIDASVTWKDIEWLRGLWQGKLILKGILTPGDALEAARVGADAIVVSNHGGRQLDGVSSTIRMLPRIADALAGSGPEIMLDGGVRSGLDVLRAVALGASGVMIGRPWVYAVAARGQAGVSALLTRFHSEMRVGMALAGIDNIAAVDRSILDLDEVPELGPQSKAPRWAHALDNLRQDTSVQGVA